MLVDVSTKSIQKLLSITAVVSLSLFLKCSMPENLPDDLSVRTAPSRATPRPLFHHNLRLPMSPARPAQLANLPGAWHFPSFSSILRHAWTSVFIHVHRFQYPLSISRCSFQQVIHSISIRFSGYRCQGIFLAKLRADILQACRCHPPPRCTLQVPEATVR